MGAHKAAVAELTSTDDGTDALRITAQFRTHDGVAFELRERGARLTILIREVAGRVVVEAFASRAPARSISCEGATRLEALRRTGVDWQRAPLTDELPPFDWEAIARALCAARPI